MMNVYMNLSDNKFHIKDDYDFSLDNNEDYELAFTGNFIKVFEFLGGHHF